MKTDIDLYGEAMQCFGAAHTEAENIITACAEIEAANERIAEIDSEANAIMDSYYSGIEAIKEKYGE